MSTVKPEIPADPIQAVINDVQNKPGAFPLEVAIPGTPQVFKGATPQEVLDQLVAAQAEATRTIREERTQREAAQQEVATLRGQLPQPSTADAATQEKLRQYYETWTKNPDAATQKQVEELFGAPIDVIRQTFQATASNTAAGQFLQWYPEYQNTPENGTLLANEVKRQFGTGVGAGNPRNLESAYHELRRQGRIQTSTPPLAGADHGAPPPNFRGTSAPTVPQFNPYDIPLTDLKAILDRASAQGLK